MKANDLRIGNWVKIKEEFSERDIPLETLEFQIEGFNDGSKRYEEGAKQILFWSIKNKVFGTTTSGSYDIECELILLTEEWLLKFGFKKENNTIYSISDKLSSSEVGKWYFFKNENNSFTPHIKRENKFSWIGKEIKYVHQLQNLYFALTGEELLLKEI
jgi:hypothetical protein